MDNLKIYCMCIEDSYLKTVQKLNYVPVGLKNKNFSNEWLLDNTLNNISKKKSLLWRIYFLLLVLEKPTQKKERK